MQQPLEKPKPRLLIPKAPVIVTTASDIYCLSTDGEIEKIDRAAALKLVKAEMPIVCHAPLTAHRMGLEKLSAYDVLELFAFVHPAVFSVPSVRGLCTTLDLIEPHTPEDECLSLLSTVKHLLLDLQNNAALEKSDPAALAWMMHLEGRDGLQGWPWAPLVLGALGLPDGQPNPATAKAGREVWHRLPEWAEFAPEASPGHYGVTGDEAETRLQELLAKKFSEERTQQTEYTRNAAPAFSPRAEEDSPNIVLAEAGTGVGKTLGYLAPASVWAEKNRGAVWISTFTRNLQRQIDLELSRLYPTDEEKKRKVVIRKGRENYLCLLNLEEAMQHNALETNPQNAVTLGLMARWAAATRDGDLTGGDLPGWLPAILGWRGTHGLSDRRGECIYSACPHYKKCFIEKNIQKSRRADIVIANHALVMARTANADWAEDMPTRYVFDEGHHLFEAADSAFALHLSGFETTELRRWLIGSETGGKSRSRGLKRRVEDLISDNDAAKAALDAILEGAKTLPAQGWMKRIQDGAPKGVTESFLCLVRQQVYARAGADENSYSLETEVNPAIDGLFAAANALKTKLLEMKQPMLFLKRALEDKLETEAATLDTDDKRRIESVRLSLQRRADALIAGWIAMLVAVTSQPQPEFQDWLEVTRIEGRDFDVGLFRHTVDPMISFAAVMKPVAHGMLVTSASLKDGAGDPDADWAVAEKRTGAAYLKSATGQFSRFEVSSPFDYKTQTRILVVTDVPRGDAAQIAAAYRELFFASAGGALGLFTSVQRLKSVYDRLHDPVAKAGLNLYAQHIDALDTTTLIDLFRLDENACLLGTDATRDGVDVPGRSLRLIVYDRVPWPRPTLLHKARRAYFGKGYDDTLTRFRLKQAYGRLIRRRDDKGVFVVLDGMLPTRLTFAFPDGVDVERIGLKDAVAITKEFLRE